MRTTEEMDLWLRAPWKEAASLRHPLPDTDLRVIDAPPKRAVAAA